LSRINTIESLVNSYVNSYSKYQHFDRRLYVNTNLGDETKRIFENGFDIETFTYDELVDLAWMLTRELQAQVNNDHFMFWAWCFHIIFYCHSNFSISIPQWFRTDGDLIDSFGSIINLVLAPSAYASSITRLGPFIIDIIKNWYIIASPLSYAVIEGLLRRKNENYVNNDGMIHTQTFRLLIIQGSVNYSKLVKN